MKYIALALMLIITPAHAENKAPPKMGGAISNLVSKLNKVALEDLQYADALATAHNDTIAHTCWSSWITYIEVEQKAIVGPDGKPLPLPSLHVITDAQKVFNIANALAPTSPLSVACAPLGNAVKMGVLQFITAAVTGGLIGGITIP